MWDDEVEREERAIYLMAIIVLAPVVIGAGISRIGFDGGTTLCLAAVVLGAIGLVASITRTIRRPRLPRARMAPARREGRP